VISVLSVDDSPLMRRLIADTFASAQDIKVTFAKDGIEALELLSVVRPDVVTLDVNMPRMGGLQCLDQIMLRRPCPVVMVSAVTAHGAKETLEALSLGAVDFVAKPTGAISLKMSEFAPVLVDKVRSAAQARVFRSRRLGERLRLARPREPVSAIPAADPSSTSEDRLVLVGCSTGGPPALDALLEPLPADFPWPIIVAQHMPATFTGALAARLDKLCALEVVEVSRSMIVTPGRVYIGRGDADLIVSRRIAGLVVLPSPASAEHRWHPSVNRLVDSASQALGSERLICVLMTGMGNDGAAAMTRVHRGGGRTMAESKETAVVWGMPGELVRAGGAQAVLPLDALAGALSDLAR
jgi:two-component system, chemotaxis family, protein-glutamate methylesterase/glutaminase